MAFSHATLSHVLSFVQLAAWAKNQKQIKYTYHALYALGCGIQNLLENETKQRH